MSDYSLIYNVKYVTMYFPFARLNFTDFKFSAVRMLEQIEANHIRFDESHRDRMSHLDSIASGNDKIAQSYCLINRKCEIKLDTLIRRLNNSDDEQFSSGLDADVKDLGRIVNG